MKLRFQSAVIFTTVLLGAITCLTGCATTGLDRATKTGSSMQAVETDMALGDMKTGCETGCDLKFRSREEPDNETETAGKLEITQLTYQ